jgi:hypothetical protein
MGPDLSDHLGERQALASVQRGESCNDPRLLVSRERLPIIQRFQQIPARWKRMELVREMLTVSVDDPGPRHVSLQLALCSCES